MATATQARPRPQARSIMPTESPWRCLLPALAASVLLWLCYFPASLGWLAWVALVPWLALVRSEAPPRWVYFAAWIGALVFYLVALQWLRVADSRMYVTWIALAIYCSLYFPVTLAILRRLDRHTPLPLALTLPAVWTMMEFARSYLLTGFAWYYLGHTQHDVLPLIQIADLGGAYGVSFLVAAVNAIVFELLVGRGWFYSSEPRPRSVLAQASVVGVLVATAFGYGFVRLSQESFTPGPRIALLQGNVPQGVRNDASQGGASAEEMRGHFEDLHRKAVAQSPKPDLVIWPETSFLQDWIELAPDFPAEKLPKPWQRFKRDDREWVVADLPEWRTWLRSALNSSALRLTAEGNVPVMLGLNAELYTDGPRNHRYNSAVLLRPDPAAPFGGRYDKHHRVPFGEFVPFRDALPWMNQFSPYDFDYSISAGDTLTRFTLGPYRFGVLICYEDTDPDFARQYVAPGSEPVDFLVNISNDGWFHGTSEHEQHLAICRFRAVESRRSVVRAVNMGISAVIDGSGRVVNIPGDSWAASKKIAAVLTATVPLDERASLYAAWGDWLAWACCGIVLLGLTLSWKGRSSSWAWN